MSPTRWGSTRVCKTASRRTCSNCSLTTRPRSRTASARTPRVPDRHRPVDLMCRDAEGIAVAVEVKRRRDRRCRAAPRYLEFLNRDPLYGRSGGVVAQEIKPQAKVLAADRDIDWVEVDYDELRGIESPNLKLFGACRSKVSRRCATLSGRGGCRGSGCRGLDPRRQAPWWRHLAPPSQASTWVVSTSTSC